MELKRRGRPRKVVEDPLIEETVEKSEMTDEEKWEALRSMWGTQGALAELDLVESVAKAWGLSPWQMFQRAVRQLVQHGLWG